MGSFGERLQREREMRGITLEEIAEATKIGTRSLRALEEEDFDKLPGGIFNKGFVRSYSRYLGINEDQAVSDYMAALADAHSSGRATRVDTEAAPENRHNLGNIDEEQERPAARLAWVVAALAVVLAAGFAGARYVSRRGWPQLRRAQASERPVPVAATAAVTQPSAAAANPAPGLSQPAAAATKTQAAPDGGAANLAAADGFLLRIRAKRDTWVLLIVDGKQEMSGVLPTDSEKAVRAQKRIVFKTGDVAGIELFRNGQPLPLSGDDRQVKQVTITAQDIQEAANKQAQ